MFGIYLLVIFREFIHFPFFHSVMDAFRGNDDGAGISILRSFRLLRILKLVRFMPALQRQLRVMVRTLDNVMTFLVLLSLFIFTASILGMHLFGAKYTFKNERGELEVARANFDTLFWALVTVFQVCFRLFHTHHDRRACGHEVCGP